MTKGKKKFKNSKIPKEIQQKCGVKRKIIEWPLVGTGKKARVVRRVRTVPVCLFKKLPPSGKPAKGWKKVKSKTLSMM